MHRVLTDFDPHEPVAVNINFDACSVVFTRAGRCSLSLSGGFMPCRYLRPSSGQEQFLHTVITYSVRDEEHLMN